MFMDSSVSVSGIDASRGANYERVRRRPHLSSDGETGKQGSSVADSSKIDVGDSVVICPIEDVDVLVTDAGTSDEAAAEFTKSESQSHTSLMRLDR